MLGRLATWLRALGYDVAYEPHIEDAELARRAVAEDRVVLTRDTLLVKRRTVRDRFLFVESDHVREQVREVASVHPPDPGLFLTRCLRCNAPLEKAEKDVVKDEVPPYVLATRDRFARCPACGRVYWGGTHTERMREEFSGLLDLREGQD